MLRAAIFLLLILAACVGDTSGLDPAAKDGSVGKDVNAPRDASPSRDAEIPDTPWIDAGQPPPGDRYWTIEQRPGQVQFVTHERSNYPAGTVFFRVAMYPYTVCEHAGPAVAEISGDHEVEIRTWFWVEHPAEACDGITDQALRDVPIELTAGRWTIRLGTSVQEVVVGDVFDCVGDGVTCGSDCECRGYTCLPVTSAIALPNICGTPCNPVRSGCCGVAQPFGDLECEPLERCEEAGDYGSGRCVPRNRDGCFSDRECPPGMACPATDAPRSCRWTIELRGSVRHPCSSDRDCDPGLFCVENEDGRRSCDVPCFTAEMRCPPQHECRELTSFTGARWVCEFQGE